MESIPGFGGETAGQGEVDAGDQHGEKISVPGGSEWRVEVSYKTILKLKVSEGIGEIFGTELPLNVELQFTGEKFALYAPFDEGCEVEYSVSPNKAYATGSVDDSEISEYISEETHMDQYTNLHFALESKRQLVSEHNYGNTSSQKVGPRVLIVGNRFSGKSTLAKILASYAYKMDRTPILVNLHPRDGVFSMPGSLTATPISDFFDLESVNGYGSSTTSGSTFHNPKQPLVKNYGLLNHQENPEHYKFQISKLGVAVMSRLEEDTVVKNSGIIIDTPPLTNKDIGIIESIVSDFEVDIIVVIGNERLLIDLKKKFKHKLNASQLELLKVSKSGGVVEMDDTFIRQSQQESIKEYFHGNIRNSLHPFKTEIDVKDYNIYKCVDALELNAGLSFLPSGDSFTPEDNDAVDTEKKEMFSLDRFYSLLSEPSSSNLEHSIVAITQLPQNNKLPKDLLSTSVKGYVHIAKVDDARGKMKILLPFPGTFPRNHLVATGVRYTE